MTRDLSGRGTQRPRCFPAERRRRDESLAAARRLVDALAGGYDFTREVQLTAELGLGDTSSWREGGDGLDALVLWHACRSPRDARAMNSGSSSWRRDSGAFEAALTATEAAAARRHPTRVVPLPDGLRDAYRRLIARGIACAGPICG